MSQPQTLNVEYEELMARAAELEVPIAGMPTDNPPPPCAIAMIVTAGQQLALSADNMRLYLSVGERERRRLAESLRNAAKAYEEADEGGGEALDNETSVEGVTPDQVEEAVDPSTLGDTVSLMATPEPLPYYPVRQAAQDIAAGDQGTAYTNFANAWEAYQRTLLEARYRFRPFQEWWSGTASDAVEANFDSQRGWLDAMATLCGTIAAQARGVATAHGWAVFQHPTTAQIQEIDKLWVQYSSDDFFRRMFWNQIKPQLEGKYAELQRKSEEVLPEYEKRASLPLPPLSPPKPPSAYYIPPPPESPPGGDEPGPGDPGWIDPNNPDLPGDPGLDLPDPTAMPSAGAGAGGMPSMPSIPSMPDNAKLADALKDLKGGLPGGAGIKPASFGGGKGAGIPAMPLQPSTEAESSRPASAVPGAAGAGRGIPIPGAGGAAGGGAGGGMAPMAPGQGQNQGKQGSRVEGDEDDSLYTEERPWTEGAIGIAGAKPPPTPRQ